MLHLTEGEVSWRLASSGGWTSLLLPVLAMLSRHELRGRSDNISTLNPAKIYAGKITLWWLQKAASTLQLSLWSFPGCSKSQCRHVTTLTGEKKQQQTSLVPHRWTCFYWHLHTTWTKTKTMQKVIKTLNWTTIYLPAHSDFPKVSHIFVFIFAKSFFFLFQMCWKMYLCIWICLYGFQNNIISRHVLIVSAYGIGRSEFKFPNPIFFFS